MKRRSFLKRLSLAATAFSVAPGVFKALPAQKRVREVIVGVDLGAQKAFVEAFFFSRPIDSQKWAANWERVEPVIITGHGDGFNTYRQLKAKLDIARNSIATQS